MPDHDAFGRPKDEDPLAGLGWTSSMRPPGETQPLEVAPAAAPSGARRGSRLPALVAVVAVLGGGALAIVKAVGAGTDAVRGVVEDARTGLPTAEADAEGSGAPRAPAEAGALTTPRGLRAGLRILRADVPGRVKSFRLEDDRIDVTVWLKGGRLRIAQLQAGAGAAHVFTTTGAGFPSSGTFAYEAIDPAAPDHLIRAANRRLGRTRSQVNYLVATRFGDQLTWGVYYKDGAIALGDRRGRFTRRISWG